MTARSLRVVIPGGSGQVGTILARYFHAQGHEVTVLSRTPASAPWNVIRWNSENSGSWIETLEHSDICINLAGRSVNCRYTASNRAAIYNSRIRSTQILGEVISRLKHPPHLWMNASTATIYRHSFDKPMDEGTGELGGNEPGARDTWNFSIQVARAWEEAFFSAHTPRTRKIALRSAMTMSPDRGGVFDVLSGLVRSGLGGTQGAGDQMVSWIHETDFVRAIEFLFVHQDKTGVFNIAAPLPIPNAAFLRCLRKAWGMPLGLSAPEWMIEVGSLLLRTESELVLKSRYVVPGRLLESGFRFTYPSWPEAAAALVSACRSERPKFRAADVVRSSSDV